ncbi:hypothetical protein SAMN04488074_116155 [Lentzea albidocapillata subsp. violacea]|uniref:Uncharacterized protein n=1 Tax=Lentzea albidocapillata subsp. violacea TaxID=128104 RepID=A0A1G9QH65_9PSEU|nr:hypothetical protein SAMN04488074_116155 [Lentzea albidocapillata subsp. violacea]
MPATYPSRYPVTIGVACSSSFTAMPRSRTMSVRTPTTTYASSAPSSTAAPDAARATFLIYAGAVTVTGLSKSVRPMSIF